MARKTKADPTASLFGNDSEEPGKPEGPGLPADLPASWRKALEPETRKPYWNPLNEFVATERQQHTVYPPEADVFNAFRYTPLDEVKVLILGQDPYHGPGQAHGLCFSVRPGIALPPSLRNIYRELQQDVGATPVKHGYLVSWAEQGVLMLNACLTVRAGEPNSHARKGWEQFTDAAIHAVSGLKHRVVFLLWGSYAQKKEKLIDAARHTIIKGVHPSPLSADKGFFGSKPFSKVNEALAASGEKPIDWQLPQVVEETS